MTALKKRVLLVPLMILALLLTVAPIPARAGETYGLTLGGITVDNYCKGDIVAAIKAADPSARVFGSASFDASTYTLYLTDFSYVGPGALFSCDLGGFGNTNVRSVLHFDSSEDTLTIVVSGYNVLELDSYVGAEYGCGGFFDCASVLVRGGDSYDRLVLTGAETDPDYEFELNDSYGLYMNSGSLTVEGGCLTARAGKARTSTGMVSKTGAITIREDGQLIAHGDFASDGMSTGLEVSSTATGTVTVSEVGTLTGESGGGMVGSCALALRALTVNEGYVYVKSGNTNGWKSNGIECTVLSGTWANIYVETGEGSNTAAITADAVDLEDSTVTALCAAAESGDSYGIFVDGNVSFDSCEVTARSGEANYSCAIQADTLELSGNSTVEATAGASYYDSCGVYLENAAPTIAAGSTLTAAGGSVDEDNGSSYGLVFPDTAITMDASAGELIAKGYSQAVYTKGNSTGKVWVYANYLSYCNNYAVGPHQLMLGTTVGGTMQHLVEEDDLFIRARGDAQRYVTVSASVGLVSGNVACCVWADEEVRSAYLIAASYGADGKLLDLRIFRYGTGDWIEDPNDPGNGDYDVDPVYVGPNYFTFGEMTLEYDPIVLVTLVDEATFAPLCPPGLVVFK
jgi:hypothetical protein